MFTPLLVAGFHTWPKSSISPNFLHPPPSRRKEGSSTLFAPFVHPLCTSLSALEPPFCTLDAHPFCNPTPFSHPGGGSLHQGILHGGHQMQPQGSNQVPQAYMHCLFLLSPVASPRASLCWAATCRNQRQRSPCSKQGYCSGRHKSLRETAQWRRTGGGGGRLPKVLMQPTTQPYVKTRGGGSFGGGVHLGGGGGGACSCQRSGEGVFLPGVRGGGGVPTGGRGRASGRGSRGASGQA